MTIAQERLRSVGTAAGRWVHRSNYLKKWVVLGAAIGVIAGLGAVVFYLALDGASHLLLDGLGGYIAPLPSGEGGGLGTGHFTRWWAIPLVVALGGLLSGILVFSLAPEAEGHGTDAAIDAVHKNPRMIRARVVIVKIISSAITIGAGGSGGREGPTAQISAGFGSLLARTLDLSPEDGRIAVSVGIGSGIGAIFGAPLGGAVLAADIVYADDFEVEALIPGLITSIIAYTVFGFIEGFSPLFGYTAADYQFHQPVQLLWFAVIGILAGLIGLLYSASFYGITDLTTRLPGSRMIKPAIGGLGVGLLALAIPEVLGTGYGWVQHALDRQQLLALPLWIVLVLPLARIAATSLSIGSGGSGGIFGPGMVIGAFTGAAVWRLLEPIAPGVPHSPAPFVVVGMMACFGSIARAPLAVMLMVAEMTGSLSILAPAMVAVGLAYLIVRHANQTIYRSQLRNRDEARSARLRFGLPLLAGIRVADAMSEPRLVVPGSASVRRAAAALAEVGVPGAPVVDREERYLGTVAVADLATDLAADASSDGEQGTRAEPTVSRRTDTTSPSVALDANLDEAVDALPDGQGWLTVVDDDRHIHGILAVSDIVRAYHAAAQADARRMSRLNADAGIVDVQVGPESPLTDRTIAQAALPDGAIIVTVQRDQSMLLGLPDTTLRAGDLVTVLARPERIGALRELLSGSTPHRPNPGAVELTTA